MLSIRVRGCELRQSVLAQQPKYTVRCACMCVSFLGGSAVHCGRHRCLSGNIRPRDVTYCMRFLGTGMGATAVWERSVNACSRPASMMMLQETEMNQNSNIEC